MIIIIGLFGAVSAVALFIVAIMLFTGGEALLGIGVLLSMVYIVAITVVLIRLDGNMTDKENKISKLEAQIEKLKQHLGIVDEEEPEEFDKGVPTFEETETPAETVEGIRFCKNCGYQLFPEDKICPNCNTEVDNTEEENGKNSSF